MESRFRKFLSSRREKASRQASVTDQDAKSHLSGSSQWSLPTFHSRLKPKSSNQHSLTPKLDSDLLQAVGYNTVVAGKAPIFTSESVKGNGPVRLQTVRRLSTGELLVTSQNDHKTLADIRDGDYIVAGKNRHSMRSQSNKTTTPQVTPTLTPGQSHSEAFESPCTPSDTSALGWASPSSGMAEDYTFQSSEKVESGLGRSPSHAATSLQSHFGRGDDSLLEGSPKLRYSRASSVTSPSIQIVEEPNATIAALWKAEYNRLVDMYGHHKVDGNTTNFGYGNAATRPSARSLNDSGLGPDVILDVLSPPNFIQNISATRRMSETSAAPSASHDENSDASSTNRGSMISSCAASSSYTTQTNVTEHDAVVTRDDIRKIVDQMRSDYLQAFQAMEKPSPPPAKSSRSAKKRHHGKSGQSVKHAVKSSSNNTDGQARRNSRPDVSEGRYKRTPSARPIPHPVSGFGRLSPVEASPEKCPKRPTTRLQRADSATLGSIFAQLESDGRIDEHPEDSESDRIQTSSKEHAPTGLGIADPATYLPGKARRSRHGPSLAMAEPPTLPLGEEFF